MREAPDRSARCARAASRTPYAASSRNPRGADAGDPQGVERIEHPSRGRPESRLRAARARNRRHFPPVAVGHVTPPREGVSALRRAIPSPWCPRCGRCRPGISGARRGCPTRWSDRAPPRRARRAPPAQSSVSATPGDLNRSCLRSACTKMHDLLGQRLADAGHLGVHDLQFAFGGRIADPVIEAAALERVVDLAGAVEGVMITIGGCAALTVPSSGIVTWKSARISSRNASKRLVGSVEFVDQQHRRAGRVRLQRLQQRPLDQEALGKDVVLDPVAVVVALRLRRRGSRSSARRSSTHRPPPRRRAPRSIAGGSSGGAGSPASTLAISVLPTPASPSRNSGRPIRSARNSTVLSERSAR